MNQCLPQHFYQSTEPTKLAQSLLGCYLQTRIDGHLSIAKIVETEAYKAPQDKASHAYGNKRTARTEIMYSEGGKAYIYLCYGIHEMFNVVTGPKDVAHAILVRAVEPILGEKYMLDRRNIKSSKNLSNGPGKLCQALGIHRGHKGLPLYQKTSPVFITEGEKVDQSQIVAGPRVGIKYAEEDAFLPYRYYIKDCSWVSLPRIVSY